MKVTVNVPDVYFQEFVENCEKKTGAKFDNIKKLLENVNEYALKSEPTEKDEPLYKWLAAVAFDDIINIIRTKQVDTPTETPAEAQN